MADTATQFNTNSANGSTAAYNNRNGSMSAEPQSMGLDTQQNSSTGRSAKKRRKVNHGMLACDIVPTGRSFERNVDRF